MKRIRLLVPTLALQFVLPLPAQEAAPPEVSADVPAPEPAPIAAPRPAPIAAPEPAATATDAPTAPTSGFDKGFFIRSPDGRNELVINGRIQSRYTFEHLDGDDDESHFSIPRARLKVKGHTFTERVTYALQLDFGKGFVSLKDATLDWAASPGSVYLRAGQWKRPTSRQQITSSGSLVHVDRAITDKASGAGRDIGLALHNGFEKSPRFEWVVGVFNGTGDKGAFSGDVVVDPATGEGEVTSGKFDNVPGQFLPTAVFRVGYNHGKLKGYSEGDLESGPLRFGVAYSGLVEITEPGGAPEYRGVLDLILKVEGFAVDGGFFFGTVGDGSPLSDIALDSIGAHAQLSYLFHHRYLVAVRWAMVDPDGDDDRVQELLLGLSAYVNSHKLKLQVDGGPILSEAGGGTTDLMARAQLQLAF